MRVLVVDDDHDSRTIFRTAFEAFGYEVMEAGNGEEVLRLVEEQDFDVILMDMQVPGQDGWETTRALQEHPATSDVPVIGVSAHAMDEHISRARAAGCVSYLTKPIEPRYVVEEVERILRVGADRA